MGDHTDRSTCGWVLSVMESRRLPKGRGVRTFLGLSAVLGVVCLVAGCAGGGAPSPTSSSTSTAASATGPHSSTGAPRSAAPAASVPRPDHVVIVVEENHS